MVAGSIFLLISVNSFYNLLLYQNIEFTWISHPQLKDLFLFEPESFQDPTYVFQKAGHVFCFFLLAFSLSLLIKRVSFILLISVSYGVLTEIAQLYFSRSGRLFDVLYDLSGSLAFVMIYVFIQIINYYWQKYFVRNEEKKA